MNIPDYRLPETNFGVQSLTKPRRTIRTWILLLCALVFLIVGSFITLDILAAAPADFPVGTSIEIVSGSGVKVVAAQLKREHVVTSSYLLYAVIWLYHDPSGLQASTYLFTEPINVYQVAEKLMMGDFASNLLRFTHREGERATTIAENAARELTNFDTATFLALAVPQEGKLFPDTYFIPAGYSATDLVATMLAAYEKNVAPLRPVIASSSLSENEVLTLASIIEREANSPTSMNMVSGILQNRLRIGMALQTDASIEYILNKPLKDLTPADLELARQEVQEAIQHHLDIRDYIEIGIESFLIVRNLQ